MKFFQVCFVLFLTVGLLSSCNKEELKIDDETTKEITSFALNGDEKEGKDGEKDECFTVHYPVTFEMPDGETQSLNSDEEVDAMYESYKNENAEAENWPKPVFPVNVNILKEGIDKEIATVEDFKKLLDWCYGDDKEDKECFSYVFPLTIALPDGTTQTADNKDTFEGIYKEWYEANGESEEKPELQFPIQIKVDEAVIDISSGEELDDMFADCYGDKEDCYTLNFPVGIIYPDGSTATADSGEALEDLFKSWYEANEESEEKITFSYPLSVTMKDGSIAEANNDEEMEILKKDCE